MGKTKEIQIIGASGHATVVLDIIDALGITVNGVYDRDPLKQQLGNQVVKTGNDYNVAVLTVIAIGNNETRKRIASNYTGTFTEALVHPSAVISASAQIGEGTVIMPGAVVNANARIGKHCIINSNAVVEHDCIVGDFAHISPNASLAGNAIVKEGAHLGINATVIQGAVVGENTVVGAGAVVITSLPDQCTAVGVPAKPIKFHASA